MWIWIELNSGLRVQPVLLSGFSYLAPSAIPAYRAIPHVSSPHFGHFTTQPTSIYSYSPFHVLNTKLEPAFHHTRYFTFVHFWRNPEHDLNDHFIEIYAKSQILFQIFYTKLSSISSGWNRQRSLSDEHVKTFCAFGAVVPLWRYFWSNMVVATPKPLMPERTQKNFLWQLLRYNTCWDWICVNNFFK